MARVTIEDCLVNLDNRFDLVLLASKRARDIAYNPKIALVPTENDKPTVIALREIAENHIDYGYFDEKTEDLPLEDQ